MQYIQTTEQDVEETTENTSSVFLRERSTSTCWQYGTPSVSLLYPVFAFKLQHNAHWCGYMALKPNSVLKKKKRAICGTVSLGATKLLKNIPYRIISDTWSSTDVSHSALHLSEQKKRIVNLPALTGSLLQGQECQKCYGIHSAGSQLQNGLTGDLQEHRQNASDKAALCGRAEVAPRILSGVERWTNGPASWTCVGPCYRGKRFPITTSALRAHRGLPARALLRWNS